MAGRLSAKPIQVPEGVTVCIEGGVLSVRGPKGELSRPAPYTLSFAVSEDGREVIITPKRQSKDVISLLGTMYVHTQNMIHGVTEGFVKVLEIEGVGYRASVEGKDLVLSLGFSHPVRYTPPEGIDIATEKNEIHVAGIDKEAVGQSAAIIRSYKKPEPYKGKGIRYRGEHIIRKQGKKAGVGS